MFDPLIAFAAGNLNSDSGMILTCERVSRLARLGNPDCAVVIVHHALNGLAGLKKAAGFDRSSFGRGSKVLNLKARGQINIVPATANSNRQLIIACGKNSNGPEFEPIAIELDESKLWYEVKADFDIGAWTAQVMNTHQTQRGISPKEVGELVKELPLKKKDLVQAIMDETGCQKSTAYNAIAAAYGATIRLNVRREFEAIPKP